MTFEEAAAILARVTYKPGMTFYLDDIPVFGGDYALLLRAVDLPNSNGGVPITLMFHRRICADNLSLYKEDDLMNEVTQLCVFHERHEMEEWLKLDGVRLHEPHPELISSRASIPSREPQRPASTIGYDPNLELNLKRI